MGDQGILPFFDQPEPPLARPLHRPLRDLAAHNILIGASSWKYEGWLGQIYTPERYFVRGRFSRRKFEAECLAEYAETFPIVCGDFSFYQFPAPEFWARLFASAPSSLMFAFKVPEMVTVKRWPRHARYGEAGGHANEFFLHSGLLQAEFLDRLARYQRQIAVLIFEFGAMSRTGVQEFVADLEPFLDSLPAHFRYAVEVRNREFFDPLYFDALRARNVAHVFNAWSRVPELPQQIARPEAFTADFIVSRALLRAGRVYEDAVAKFQPYSRIQDPNPGARRSLKALIERAQRNKQPAFLFVNNRLEGNAPGTIQAVLSGGGEDA